MADLLGSILGSMEKPPSLGDEERKKAKARQKQMEKLQQREKEKVKKFREKIQERINQFIKDGTQQKYKFEPMEKVSRSVVHEIADVAGLTSFSFGHEEEDRYVMLWKKEFAPCDDELAAYRRGETWSEEAAKELAKQREQEKLEEAASREKQPGVTPNTNYQDKYERLIGKEAAKDAARSTSVNRSYGFVTSENKRDRRTIEQVMEDQKAKKKLKTTSGDGKEESVD